MAGAGSRGEIGKVSIFPTCVGDLLRPELAQALTRLLSKLGIPSDCPGRACCGQAAWNAGYFAEARRTASLLLDSFSGDSRVICPSGSCTAMVVHNYPELFAGDSRRQAEAARLSGRIREFSQFLVEDLGITELGASFPFRVAYHPSCHAARSLGIDVAPRALLGRTRGIELVEIPSAERCCGFGGFFAAKMADLSLAMGRAKAAAILQSGAEILTAVDPGCLLQIESILREEGSRVWILHLAELLDEGMRRAEGTPPNSTGGEGDTL
ncbi:Lactate utilization protein A [Methylacidimicrobium cyclopophantes]|uniref:Lactate utilization protein A n=1 Tax=Methylacidimicrobium cyclopophantes TaxID=1041766 RepID=A0A5E6M665_9BACT|nr:(Fe-S)-binding protein [Methylacidimicrobium cyclopophantes]VVM04789.1 Lactate utilization protein A [Methylacidimicrobium cyclopophantes]